MKIAIFSDNFYPELSGISDSIITTAKELAKRGHTIKFFVPTYTKANFKTAGIDSKKEINLGENITIERLFAIPFAGPTLQARMVIPTGVRTLAIRKFKPDIIHSHLFFGVGVEALVASKILKIPFIGTNHTAITEFIPKMAIGGETIKKVSIKYVNWYYGKCQFVSAPSQSVFDEMIQNGFKVKHKVISNPTDTSIFNKTFKNGNTKKTLKEKFGLTDKTIVYVGRLAPEKNIEMIVSAVAIAKKTIPDISLAIAGHGISLNSLKKLVEELHIIDSVKFLGTLSHAKIAQLYRASEVFTITSTSETQSMTLIQAMACGLPVVGVKARALPEYIKGNGVLINPGDTQALAKNIVSLLEDEELRNKFGENGFNFVQKFSPPAIALEWEEIYNKEITKTIKN